MFKITFVCTGNRCRSPLAAALVRRLKADTPLEVSSCGTMDVEGAPSPPGAIEAARALGVDLSPHRSSYMMSCDLLNQDLVIGFERSHIAAAVVDGGAEHGRTFLLLELIRVLEQGDPPLAHLGIEASARARIEHADGLRRSSGFVAGEEIEDPIGGPATVHRRTAERLDELCERLVRLLFPAPRPEGGPRGL